MIRALSILLLSMFLFSCSKVKDRYYLMTYDPDTESRNFFKIEIEAKTKFTRSKVSTGLYDRRAVEKLFSEDSLHQEYQLGRVASEDSLSGAEIKKARLFLDKANAVNNELKLKHIYQAYASLGGLIGWYETKLDLSPELKQNLIPALDRAKVKYQLAQQLLQNEADMYFYHSGLSSLDEFNNYATILFNNKSWITWKDWSDADENIKVLRKYFEMSGDDQTDEEKERFSDALAALGELNEDVFVTIGKYERSVMKNRLEKLVKNLEENQEKLRPLFRDNYLRIASDLGRSLDIKNYEVDESGRVLLDDWQEIIKKLKQLTDEKKKKDEHAARNPVYYVDSLQSILRSFSPGPDYDYVLGLLQSSLNELDFVTSNVLLPAQNVVAEINANIEEALNILSVVRAIVDGAHIVRFFDHQGNEIDAREKTMLTFMATDTSPFTRAITKITNDEEVSQNVLRIALGSKIQDAEVTKKRLEYSNSVEMALLAYLTRRVEELGDEMNAQQLFDISTDIAKNVAGIPVSSKDEIAGFIKGARHD